MLNNKREPKQKRAIEKKEKIIKVGFDLICQKGYYNTNTAEIAKKANVSTGILYQYFKDKYDIFIIGLEKYGDSLFFPMLSNAEISFSKINFDNWLKQIINNYINNHKISATAHEEIMSMVHSDKKVAKYYYEREMQTTNSLKDIFINSGFNKKNLYERLHIMIGLIDNLCHEMIYHKHKDMDYNIMTNIVIDCIKNLFKNDLI